MRFSRAGLALVFVLGCSAAAQAADNMDKESFMNKGQLKWGEAPPSLPKGAKVAVLHGDPGKPGAFAMRLSAPGGYKIPPHWHSQSEDLTVISGTFYLGMGDKADGSDAHALASGGFHHLPAKAHHYAFSKGPSVIQVNGDGPFDINYLNAQDDPSKAAEKSAMK